MFRIVLATARAAPPFATIAIAALAGVMYVTLLLTMQAVTASWPHGLEGRLAPLTLSEMWWFAIVAWSIISTTQRAAVVASCAAGTIARGGTVPRVAWPRVALTVAVWGAAYGAIECAVWEAALNVIPMARGLNPHAAVLFVVWIGSRAVVGIVTAILVRERRTLASAVRLSARRLSGHRIASVLSRAPLAVAFAFLGIRAFADGRVGDRCAARADGREHRRYS